MGGVEKVFDGGEGRGALLRQVGPQVDRDHQLPQKDHFCQIDHFHKKKLRGQQTLEQNYLFVNMNKKQKNDLGFKKKI